MSILPTHFFIYFLDIPFVCIHVHAGDPRVPPRGLTSGPKPCGGNYAGSPKVSPPVFAKNPAGAINIPLPQSCENICCNIVAIMGAISCIDPTLWRFGFLATKSTLPKEISNIPCMLFAKGAYPLTDCKECQSTVTWDQFLPTISVEWQPLVRTTVFQ